MRRYVLTALLSILLFPLLGSVASAHVLQVDGNIGAVLHIEPDDNPVSGEPVTYVLAFQDDTNQLKLSGCNCIATVLRDSSVISTKPLTVTDDQLSRNTITFPQPAVYTLRIHGTPVKSGAFQAFTLNFAVRVTGGTTKAQPFPPLLWAGLGLAIALILLAAFVIEYGGSARKQEP